jgi:hypothetical protein
MADAVALEPVSFPKIISERNRDLNKSDEEDCEHRTAIIYLKSCDDSLSRCEPQADGIFGKHKGYFTRLRLPPTARFCLVFETFWLTCWCLLLAACARATTDGFAASPNSRSSSGEAVCMLPKPLAAFRFEGAMPEIRKK